ncbi:MAG: hypothetical protein ACHP9Y_01565 [Gammaproteobacteria bacterium]
MAIHNNSDSNFSIGKYFSWMLWPFRALVSPIERFIAYVRNVRQEIKEEALPDEAKLQKWDELYTEQLFLHYHYFAQECEKLSHYRDAKNINQAYFSFLKYDELLGRLKQLYHAKYDELEPEKSLALKQAAISKVKDFKTENKFKKCETAQAKLNLWVTWTAKRENKVDIAPCDLVNCNAYNDYNSDNKYLSEDPFQINVAKINYTLAPLVKQGIYLFSNFWSLTNIVNQLRIITSTATKIIQQPLPRGIKRIENPPSEPPSDAKQYKQNKVYSSLYPAPPPYEEELPAYSPPQEEPHSPNVIIIRVPYTLTQFQNRMRRNLGQVRAEKQCPILAVSQPRQAPSAAPPPPDPSYTIVPPMA